MLCAFILQFNEPMAAHALSDPYPKYQDVGRTGVFPASPTTEWMINGFKLTGYNKLDSMPKDAVFDNNNRVFYINGSSVVAKSFSGSTLWSVIPTIGETRNPGLNNLFIYNDKVYAYSLDPTNTGVVLFEINKSNGTVIKEYLLPDMKAVIGINSNIILAISPTGTLAGYSNELTKLWETSYKVADKSTIAMEGSLVYVIDVDSNRIKAIKATNGHEVWTYAFSGTSYTPLTVRNGKVYVITSANKLFAISSSGNLMWSYNVPFINGVTPEPSIDDSGRIFVISNQTTGTKNIDKLLAIEPDGTLAWEQTLNNSNKPHIGDKVKLDSNSNIYVSTFDSGDKYLSVLSSIGTVKHKLPGFNTPITVLTNGYMQFNGLAHKLYKIEPIVTSIHFNESYSEIGLHETPSLTVKAKLSNGDTIDNYSKMVDYNVTPKSKLAVENGVIKPYITGEVTITAADKSNPDIKTSMKVSIVRGYDIKGIEIKNPPPLDFAIGETHKLEVAANCFNGFFYSDYRNINWVSEDPDKATVDSNGLVKGIKSGWVTILAKDKDDPTIYAEVTFFLTDKIIPKSIVISNAPSTLEVDSSYRLTVDGQMELEGDIYHDYKKIIWSSSDESTLKIDENGVITAVAPGEATITAVCKYDSSIVASTEIRVIEKTRPSVSSIAFDVDTPNLMAIGSKGKFRAIITYEDGSTEIANASNAYWESSDPYIVEVDDGGNYVIKNRGQATITVTAKANYRCTTTFTIESKHIFELAIDNISVKADESVPFNSSQGNLLIDLPSLSSDFVYVVSINTIPEPIYTGRGGKMVTYKGLEDNAEYTVHVFIHEVVDGKINDAETAYKEFQIHTPDRTAPWINAVGLEAGHRLYVDAGDVIGLSDLAYKFIINGIEGDWQAESYTDDVSYGDEVVVTVRDAAGNTVTKTLTITPDMDTDNFESALRNMTVEADYSMPFNTRAGGLNLIFEDLVEGYQYVVTADGIPNPLYIGTGGENIKVGGLLDNTEYTIKVVIRHIKSGVILGENQFIIKTPDRTPPEISEIFIEGDGRLTVGANDDMLHDYAYRFDFGMEGNWQAENYTTNYELGKDLTIIVRDTEGNSVVRTITVSDSLRRPVPPPEQAPPEVDDYRETVLEDSKVSGKVVATDINNDPLTYSLNTEPYFGTAIVKPDGTWTYTPYPNYNGEDSFTIKVDDGNGGIAIATISITVLPVNDKPTVPNYSRVTEQNTSISGVIIASDIDGDLLTYKLISSPSNGIVTVNANGTWLYTPNKDFYGTDRFIVEVNDANGGTATSTITITVNKVETNPVPKDPPSKGDDKGNNKGGNNNNPDESGEIPDSGLPTDPGKPGTGNKDKTPPDKSPRPHPTNPKDGTDINKDGNDDRNQNTPPSNKPDDNGNDQPPLEETDLHKDGDDIDPNTNPYYVRGENIDELVNGNYEGDSDIRGPTGNIIPLRKLSYNILLKQPMGDKSSGLNTESYAANIQLKRTDANLNIIQKANLNIIQEIKLLFRAILDWFSSLFS